MRENTHKWRDKFSECVKHNKRWGQNKALSRVKRSYMRFTSAKGNFVGEVKKKQGTLINSGYRLLGMKPFPDREKKRGTGTVFWVLEK